ncbi:endo-1,4-beta-xylanase [Butyrivibrio hungatei DSM 14810]|uniref:Beta-xylanase n=1 Tax=Butyrivibrio hungatei DSM 14810 TaxID=1121132 RepID=A0A1M7SKH1_9FIRM|nr:endo-1,4-beta-xylanase [Butyrivibrio hungatei]SHN58955.1 endo-1,4-beta-xylanase [Butyrivibrio hungatei DSM 14810]
MKIKTLLSGALIVTLLAGCASSAVTNTDPSANVSATDSTNIEESANDVLVTEASSSEESTDVQAEYTDYAPLKDLCSDYFTLGVGINGSSLENQTLNIPHYMEMCEYHFNSCTMTNLMKSCYILDQFGSQANLKDGNEEPALNFASIDPTLKWCQEHGMKMRGHTLVWHTQAPNWFFREGYTDEGEYVDKDTMLLRMESYIKQLVTHVQEEYPGVVYCWDVVNEAVEPDACDPDSFFKCRVKTGDEPNPWYETIGEDYVEMAFTYARKYVTDGAKLFYNDYNTYQEPKTEGIYALCSRLKEKGLIDGIGMQGYWGIDYPKDEAIKKAIEKFSELDLEIHVTELSIGIDNETDALIEKQGERYGEVFKLLHDMDKEAGGPANITNVTLFGLVDHYRDGDTTNTRIFDMNYDPKPAYFKIKEVMENY